MKKVLLTIGLYSVLFNVHAQNKLTPELMWSLKRVGPMGLSADGKHVFYSETKADVVTEKSSRTYKRAEIKSGKVTDIDETVTEIFQRNGNTWYRLHDNRIEVSSDGGKTWNHFASVDSDADVIKVSPDGKHIAYTKEVLVQNVLGINKYKDLPKTSVQVYDNLNYRHWDNWEDGKYSHVFVHTISSNETMDLLTGQPFDVPQKPFGGGEDVVWSPDSKCLLYVCKKKTGKDYAVSTNTDVYAYNLATNNTTNITEGMMGYDVNPTFSPNGKFLAIQSMARDGFEADKNDIYLFHWDDAKAIKFVNLTANWDNTVNDMAWAADSRSLYCIAPSKGTVQVFLAKLPPDLPNVKAIPIVVPVSQGNFDVNGIVGLTDGELIVTRTDFNHATEIYAMNTKTGLMRQISKANEDVYSKLTPSKSELRMVKTQDGKDMGVWVIYPPDFTPAKKYPTLLYCQGGPQSALSQFYSFRWNFALMAAQGYIVVAPNRRGMPGWGTEWNEAISKDWGGMPMQDYLSAIDAVSKESYVDKSRLGCVGASYGGYSVFMLAGMHNNRFKSFIAHCGLFDMRSWYGTTEEMWFANWDLGGSYWSKPEPKGYTAFNPSEYVAKWNTPIMIIQGGKDYRVPIGQGQQAFQAAQLQGIKSRFVYFNDENHWVSKPQNGLAWQREFFSWLSETLK